MNKINSPDASDVEVRHNVRMALIKEIAMRVQGQVGDIAAFPQDISRCRRLSKWDSDEFDNRHADII